MDWLLPVPDGALLALAAAPAGDDAVRMLARLFGRLHPALVHFPIALILTAGLLELLSALRRGSPRSSSALPCVVIGAGTGVVAAWFGWLSAAVEPPGMAVAQTLFFHRWIGIVVAALAGGAALLALLDRVAERAWTVNGYRGALALAVLLVPASGYLGAELVYGEGHLLEALRPAPAPPPIVVADPVDPDAPGLVFARDVQPILDARCVECHGPRKRKGMLRLDGLANVFAGPPEFWVVKAGAPEESLLYERITLPADDPDRMPKRGEPLTADEIEVIRAWIADHVMPPGGGLVEEPAPDSGPKPVVIPVPVAPPADESARAAEDAALAALRGRGAVASRIAADTAEIDVNLSLAEPPAGDDDLALLDGLEPTLAWLDLARSDVTDEGVARLSRFPNLRRLHLENTAIGDDGVARLTGLVALEYLNLYGTQVTDTALAHLERLPALRKLYLWQTGVTEEGMAALRAARPDLTVVGEVYEPVEVVAETGEDGASAATDGAEEERLPACCASAKAAGGECTHPCCVEARAAGRICETCAAP